MAQLYSGTGVTQAVNIQVDAAIQKLFISITGVATVAQLQAVQIEVLKVGNRGGTDQLVFQGALEDYAEMNAQMEIGATFSLFTNTFLGNVVLGMDNSVDTGGGDNLIVNIRSLIATMVLNVYGLETKRVGASYTKMMPVNVSGIGPRRQKITYENVIFIPNDGTIIALEVFYKGRSVRMDLAELQAINRDLRSIISPNYNAAVYAGFVNWLMYSLKDAVEVQVIPSGANTNTTYYLIDQQLVFVTDNGNRQKANGNPGLIDSTKGNYGGVKNPGNLVVDKRDMNKMNQ